MTDLLLIIALLGFAFFVTLLALELYHEGRRWWFHRRTRKYVEQEWRNYYARRTKITSDTGE